MYAHYSLARARQYAARWAQGRVPREQAPAAADLLAELERLAAEALDEVGEEDVYLDEVLGAAEVLRVLLAAQLHLLPVQQPLLVVARLPEVPRHRDPKGMATVYLYLYHRHR